MNTETLEAVLSAVAILIVDIAAMLGYSMDTSTAADIVYMVVFIVATCYGIWKNHNFTEAAQEAQELLDDLKAAEKTSSTKEQENGEQEEGSEESIEEIDSEETGDSEETDESEEQD